MIHNINISKGEEMNEELLHHGFKELPTLTCKNKHVKENVQIKKVFFSKKQ